MEHAHDADAVVARHEKHELFADWESSQTRQQPIHAAADVWRTNEELKDFIESLRETVGRLKVMPGDTSPDFELIEVRVARLDNARHAQRC